MEQLLEESGKSRREAQETAVFCQVDDMMYSALSRAEFLYTQQIGREGLCATTLSGKDNRFLLTNLLGDTIIIVKKRGR